MSDPDHSLGTPCRIRGASRIARGAEGASEKLGLPPRNPRNRSWDTMHLGSAGIDPPKSSPRTAGPPGDTAASRHYRVPCCSCMPLPAACLMVAPGDPPPEEQPRGIALGPSRQRCLCGTQFAHARHLSPSLRQTHRQPSPSRQVAYART